MFQCFNNIYNPKTNLSNIDVMAEDVIHRELEWKLKFIIQSDGKAS